MNGRHRRRPGRHRAIAQGRHRRPPLHQTIKATSGAFAGAAVLGTAAATAGTAVALTSAFLSPAGSHLAVPATADRSEAGATRSGTSDTTATDRAELAGTVRAAGTGSPTPAPQGDRAAGSTGSRDPQRDRGRPGDGRPSTESAAEPSTEPSAEPTAERSTEPPGERATGSPRSTGSLPDRATRSTRAPGQGIEAAGTRGESRSQQVGPESTVPRSGAASVRSSGEPSVGSSPRPSGGRPADSEYHGRGRVTARKVIKFALTQVGVREDAQGRTKYQQWYAGSARARETAFRSDDRPSAYATAPWCDMFISWLGDQTGTSDSMGSDAYTVAHARWFFSEGRWGYRARPGAVAFFAWDPPWFRDMAHVDHVGLVVRNNSDGTITTIEGNSYNAVQLRIRPVAWVVGYGYPEFAD